MRTTLLSIGLTLPLIACVTLSAPIASPTSARPPTPTITVEPNLSPTLPPTTTSEPTLSPVPPPSASAASTPAESPTESTALDCDLLIQSVKNGTHYKPQEQFSINWKVRNTGTAGWGPDSVDFTYIAGTRMYQYGLVQLKETVDPGNIAYLIADMRAPKNPGKYSTTWSLRQGDNYFCHVSLTIFVD